MTWTNPTTYTPGSPATPPATSTDWLNYFTNNLAALMPVGAYMYMHASPGSSGLVNGCYIECNGQAVSRTTYATLFALIGTTYGSGNGSTTFNVPDAGGRFLPGTADATGHTDVNALGKSDGGAVSTRSARHHHTFTDPGHSHSGSGLTTSSTNAAHTHAYTSLAIATLVGTAIPGGPSTDGWTTYSTGGDGGHTHVVDNMSATSVSGGLSVTPGGSQPVDSPSYMCGGTLFIKVI